MEIKGKIVTLHPATMQDRSRIYDWLAHSDLTSSMLGLPLFPENLVPTWEEFMADYEPYFFEGALSLSGRCFVIKVNDEPVGQINYNEIDLTTKCTELDIWLSDSKNTGKGYGTDALETLCNFLHQVFELTTFYIAPSVRNSRATKSYLKAGFVISEKTPPGFIPDYKDTVLLIKTIAKKQD